MIRFNDLGAVQDEVAGDIAVAVARVLASGWYIGGPEVSSFEQEWADFCGAAHCVGLGNGLDALQLALRSMDVGAGDEVIVASNSYIATVLAVTSVGATPVFVEPDPATHNLDPARVEEALTSRTRVILPTHLYGQPADLDPLLDIARRHGLRLLEDAAQAHGASYKGRRLGAHGDAVAWSFYPTKNLGAAGDAGALTTNDAELARRVRLLGNYGSSKRYVNEIQGVNSRLDALQAAILSVKLKHLEHWNRRRGELAAILGEALADCDITPPHVPNWAEPVWHLFVIQAPERDRLAERMREAGIETLVHYPIPPHLQQAYASLGLQRGSFPIAEHLAQTVLSLPMGPHLSDEDARTIAQTVRAAS